MIKIPGQSKQLIQTNKSTVLGNWSSFNLDLTSNVGKILISPRGLATTTSADDSDLKVASAFRVLGTSGDANYGIWACCGTKMFKNTGVIYGNFTEDSTTGTPTLSTSLDQDLEIFGGKLYVSGLANGDLAFLDTIGNWSSTAANGIYGSMTVYGNRLYYTQGVSTIGSTIDGSTLVAPSGNPNTISYSLNLGNFGGSTRNTITCLRAGSNRIWIATINKDGGKGRIYEWDGASVNPTRFYQLESGGALAMVIKDDVPWIMDVDGRLLAFNGGSFQEMARLPISNNRYLKNPFDGDAYDRFIHFNGMSVQDDRILMLINNQKVGEGSPIEENLPSGIWEYSKDNGLYHKHSFSTWKYQITTTETDYGFNRISAVGALSTFKSTSSAANYNGTIICGLAYTTDATTTAYGIFIDDTNDEEVKTGYLVTNQIFSNTIRDTWQNIQIAHQELLNSTDSIKVKYRTKTETSTELTATWASTTTFITTTDLRAYVGYEVEVLNGTGSGMVAHITSVDWDNTNYTIHLDETITGATGTSKVRIQNWKKLTGENKGDFTQFNIGVTSRWIQFKVFFKGSGPNEIDELIINNVKQQ